MPTFKNLESLYEYLRQSTGKALGNTSNNMAKIMSETAERVVYGAGTPKDYERGQHGFRSGHCYSSVGGKKTPEAIEAMRITKGKNEGNYRIGYNFKYDEHLTEFGSKRKGRNIDWGSFLRDYGLEKLVQKLIIEGIPKDTPVGDGFWTEKRDYVKATYNDIKDGKFENDFINSMKKYGIKVSRGNNK